MKAQFSLATLVIFALSVGSVAVADDGSTFALSEPAATSGEASQVLKKPDCGSAPVGNAVTYRTDFIPGVEDEAKPGKFEIRAVTIAYQCPSSTKAGALAPEGLRMTFDGGCSKSGCPAGTAVLTRDFSGTAFAGTVRDGVGVRSVKLARTASGRLVLAVRSREVAGEDDLVAQYLLVPEAKVAPARGAKPKRWPVNDAI